MNDAQNPTPMSVGQGGCLMATPMLLTYAMPLRQTYLTGKMQDTANWITPAEMPEVTFASAHTYDPATRTTSELLQDITSWSPKQRTNAARELDKRTSEYATMLPILHAMAANESAIFRGKWNACSGVSMSAEANEKAKFVPSLSAQAAQTPGLQKNSSKTRNVSVASLIYCAIYQFLPPQPRSINTHR